MDYANPSPACFGIAIIFTLAIALPFWGQPRF
jgi:hypothetical protein